MKMKDTGKWRVTTFVEKSRRRDELGLREKGTWEKRDR